MRVRSYPLSKNPNLTSPAHRLGRERWFIDRRNKWETKRFFSAFSQRAPAHIPSPPSRWAGRYEPFAVRAAGQVTSEKYSLSSYNPTREGGPGEEPPPPGGSPPFLPKKWGPGWASQGSLPFQRRGPIPTTSPSPAQKQADTPAEKHISLAPRRAIRYNRARNGQEAET